MGLLGLPSGLKIVLLLVLPPAADFAGESDLEHPYAIPGFDDYMIARAINGDRRICLLLHREDTGAVVVIGGPDHWGRRPTGSRCRQGSESGCPCRLPGPGDLPASPTVLNPMLLLIPQAAQN